MSRALRRHQAREGKKAKGPSAAALRTALPRPSAAAPAAARRRGLGGFVPRFIMDIYSELRKVVWPSRDETIHLAVVVVIVTIIFGAILGAIDIGFGWLIDKTLLS